MKPEDRLQILRRRALLAAAVVSVGACSPQCNPLVCLSVLPPDAGRLPVVPPTDAGTQQAPPTDAGAKQTLVGIARGGKAGPAIIVDGTPVYVMGVDAWPSDWIGERVEVQGQIVTRQGLPEKPPPTEGGIVGPYRVIENATWKLAE